MPPKQCDPKCTARCNKNRRIGFNKADKACDPKCTGRCNEKRDTGTPSIQEPLIDVIFVISATQLAPTCAKDTNKNEKLDDGTCAISANKNGKLGDGTNVDGTTANKLGGKKISCIIFDLDGVVLDIETVYERVISELVKKYQLPDSEAKIIVDLQDNITAREFCTTYNVPISPEEFAREFRKISIRNLADTPLMPGVEDVVNYLISKKYPVALTTASNQAAFKLKTAKYSRLINKFNPIVLGGSDPEIKTRKPSPEIYQICCSRFPSKPNPDNILVFEDAPEGVEAAMGAGMNVIWLPNKYITRGDGKGAVAVLNSFKEFNPKEFGLS